MDAGTTAGQIHSQTEQQFTGPAQVRQARANQPQREATSLTKTYSATAPGVLAVQASLKSEQTVASRLGVVSSTISTAAPTAPASGWVMYRAPQFAAGAVAYRDTVLSAEVPPGTPPCEPGAPPSTPPATNKR